MTIGCKCILLFGMVLLASSSVHGQMSVPDNSVHMGPNPTQEELMQNDLVVLNFALTLEQLGFYFYSHFLEVFTPNDFASYGGPATYYYLAMIRDHERAHVDIVTSSIVQFGGTPHGPCNYTFSFNSSGITTVEQFLRTATVLENICTMALDGSAAAIYNKTLLMVAAELATVEGRHSSFLQYILTAGTPTSNPAGPQRAFPFTNYTQGGNGIGGFEVPFTPAQVLDAVMSTGLIGSCPFSLIQPAFLSIDFNLAVQRGNMTSMGTMNPTLQALNQNDLLALNYALTLENLEAAFYTQFQSVFTAQDFARIGLDPVYDYATFNLIRDHEQSHAAFLTSVIASLQGSPMMPCSYDFGINTTALGTASNEERAQAVREYIMLAQTFENLGVSAYDGAINTITNKVLIAGAATIATVEARHAAYLNYLNISAIGNTNRAPFYNRGNPYPSAVDPALSPAIVLQMASGFIRSCPMALEVPQILYVFATAANATASTAGSTGSSGGAANTASSSAASAASTGAANTGAATGAASGTGNAASSGASAASSSSGAANTGASSGQNSNAASSGASNTGAVSSGASNTGAASSGAVSSGTASTGSSSCSASVSSSVRTSWQDGANTVSLYDAILTNTGSAALFDISIQILAAGAACAHPEQIQGNPDQSVYRPDTCIRQYWSLGMNGDGSFGLPSWLKGFNGLAPGEQLNFGFIANSADFSISTSCSTGGSASSSGQAASSSASSSSSATSTSSFAASSSSSPSSSTSSSSGTDDDNNNNSVTTDAGANTGAVPGSSSGSVTGDAGPVTGDTGSVAVSSGSGAVTGLIVSSTDPNVDDNGSIDLNVSGNDGSVDLNVSAAGTVEASILFVVVAALFVF